MGALVGAVMKLSQGKADGKAVTALLNQRRDREMSPPAPHVSSR